MRRYYVHTYKNSEDSVHNNHYIRVVILVTLLIMSCMNVGYSQTKDTLHVNGTDLEFPIFYSAKDSIFSDFKKKQVHLFGNAKVDNGEINLNAGYILIDLNKKEVYATYRYDKDSNKIEIPEFTDGSDKMTAHTLRYNFDTEKAYIESVSVMQDENFLYMEKAKRHPNDELHFLRGRFTTCDLEEPHYHFQLSRAILIPDKRIVSGPMNLWIKGVPTPLGLPFSIIPQVEDKAMGLVFPQLIPFSQFGFGFQDLGYYIPVNDQFQTTIYSTLYNRGSWGIGNVSDYNKRYKYNGNLEVRFQQLRYGFPDNSNTNKTTVIWNHVKDPKSNPSWNFRSKVNFISDNNTKNALDPLNPNYFNNTMASDISVQRLFPGKPVLIGARLSMRQNSKTQNISLTSPDLTVNVNRVFPFKKLIKGKSEFQQVFSRLGVTYAFQGQNISTFGDSLIPQRQYDKIANQFMNGISQVMTVQTTAGFFKNTWKLSPSSTYSNYINFQQVRKSYDSINNMAATDTIQLAGVQHDLKFNATLTTVLYTYYKFLGKKKPLLRQVTTPAFSFSYIPMLNALITDSVGVDKKPVTYSPFESSVFRTSSTREQALLGFSVNNTFELKRKSEKDTVTGFSKTRLVDALQFSGTYDFLKESMNLSDIAIGMRVSPMEWFNFVLTSSFSPYGWVDSTGASISKYAVQSNGQLGRFTSTGFATTFTITSKESRKKLDQTYEQLGNTWDSDFQYYYLHPESILDFTIPWKVNFTHNYTVYANTNKTTESNEVYLKNQTLQIDGDASFTKRWKLSGMMNFSITEFDVTNTRLTLTRDMHCWALNFVWIPIGGNQSFLLTIRSTSTLFQDAKIDIRKPPAFL